MGLALSLKHQKLGKAIQRPKGRSTMPGKKNRGSTRKKATGEAELLPVTHYYEWRPEVWMRVFGLVLEINLSLP